MSRNRRIGIDVILNCRHNGTIAVRNKPLFENFVFFLCLNRENGLFLGEKNCINHTYIYINISNKYSIDNKTVDDLRISHGRSPELNLRVQNYNLKLPSSK